MTLALPVRSYKTLFPNPSTIMKRLLLFIIAAFVPVAILGYAFPERALEPPVIEELYRSQQGADVVAFVRDGCPHCAEFEAYALKHEWAVEYHEVTQIDSQKMFHDLQEHVPNLNQGVPTIFINGSVSQGYDDDQDGESLKKKLEECQASEEGCLPFTDFLASDAQVELATTGSACTEDCEADESKYIFDLWIFGTVNLLDLSLPALAILLGTLDGFNPCAMWVLITLLTLLIATRDMKRVLIIGGTFLFVSGAMYYLFIAAWLNVFLIIGYNFFVQKAIGAVAIGAGGFYLYEALGKDPNVCHVTSYKSRQRVIARMQKVASAAAWPAMLLGVSILAISVNMIELVCTAGLPAIFTQILAFNDVTDAMRYWYIFLFILMYMIDDTIIFLIAIFTLHATGITTKYRRFTLIFGGVLMYSLGILLIFFPELLTFH
jgi:glutaredoxin